MGDNISSCPFEKTTVLAEAAASTTKAEEDPREGKMYIVMCLAGSVSCHMQIHKRVHCCGLGLLD